MNICFIGTGNMAGAIIRGLSKEKSFSIYGYDLSEKALEVLKDEAGLTPVKSTKKLIDLADVLVLSVKPNILPNVLDEYKEDIAKKDPLVISIAAGKNIEFIENYLTSSRIVRVMPNINARALASTTSYCVNDRVTKADCVTVEKIFKKVGSIIKVTEKDLEILSVLSSASIAYTYLYIDALAAAALKAGLPKALALEIAADSVLGSAKLVLQEDIHPAALIDMVCSPGGTTIEGIASLKESGFEASVRKAFDAAYEKGEKIKKGI
ncbi:MAG: pyrroline-5-carboxylate reductase [Firmicutes bacterium]|nr:pyrroline-5-carboxylate reductase [Bacillota bacterium]